MEVLQKLLQKDPLFRVHGAVVCSDFDGWLQANLPPDPGNSAKTKRS